MSAASISSEQLETLEASFGRIQISGGGDKKGDDGTGTDVLANILASLKRIESQNREFNARITDLESKKPSTVPPTVPATLEVKDSQDVGVSQEGPMQHDDAPKMEVDSAEDQVPKHLVDLSAGQLQDSRKGTSVKKYKLKQCLQNLQTLVDKCENSEEGNANWLELLRLAESHRAMLGEFSLTCEKLAIDDPTLQMTTDPLSIDILNEGLPEIASKVTPIQAVGDGSCLFNALSIAIVGHDGLALELRLRCCIEMIIHRAEIEERGARLKYGETCALTYLEDVRKATEVRGWSNCFTIHGLAIASGIAIRQFYPNLPNQFSGNVQVCNQIFDPIQPATHKVSIMFTSADGSDNLNHFVPLRPKAEGLAEMDKKLPFKPAQLSPCIDDNLKERECDPEFATEVHSSEMLGVEDIKTAAKFDEESIEGHDAKPLSDIQIDVEKVKKKVRIRSHHKETAECAEELEDSIIVASEELKPLLIFQAVKYAMNNDPLPKLPIGPKGNQRFCIDNTSNYKSLKEGENCSYPDDRGAWQGGRSTTQIYHVDKDTGRLKLMQGVLKKDGKFVKAVPGSKEKEALTPQPRPEETLYVKTVYHTHKHNKKFKKKTTMFVEAPSTYAEILLRAVVEYTGIDPMAHPHGNATKSLADFYRTYPDVMDKMKAQAPLKNPKELFMDNFTHEDLRESSRNQEQAKNIKKNLTRKEKGPYKSRTNLADQVVEVANYVVSGVHNCKVMVMKHEQPLPDIMMWSDELLAQVRNLCGNKGFKPGILAVDRTFNLGKFFLTTTVFKQTNLCRHEGDDNSHPVFLGPVLLHFDAKYPTYKNFFSTLEAALHNELEGVQISGALMVGSDEEAALVKALEKSFPGAFLVHCTMHLKNNALRHLEEQGIPRKDRNELVQEIFGKNGLLDSASEREFYSQKKIFVEEYGDCFKPDYLESLLTRVYAYVMSPALKEAHINTDWTNNICESMNAVLKNQTKWKLHTLPELIVEIDKLYTLQKQMIAAAMQNIGLYRLAPHAKKKTFQITPAKWHAMSKDERNDLIARFCLGFKQKATTVSTKDGKLTLPLPSQASGKKPGHPSRRGRTSSRGRGNYANTRRDFKKLRRNKKKIDGDSILPTIPEEPLEDTANLSVVAENEFLQETVASISKDHDYLGLTTSNLVASSSHRMVAKTSSKVAEVSEVEFPFSPIKLGKVSGEIHKEKEEQEHIIDPPPFLISKTSSEKAASKGLMETENQKTPGKMSRKLDSDTIGKVGEVHDDTWELFSFDEADDMIPVHESQQEKSTHKRSAKEVLEDIAAEVFGAIGSSAKKKSRTGRKIHTPKRMKDYKVDKPRSEKSKKYEAKAKKLSAFERKLQSLQKDMELLVQQSKKQLTDSKLQKVINSIEKKASQVEKVLEKINEIYVDESDKTLFDMQEGLTDMATNAIIDGDLATASLKNKQKEN